VLIALATFVSVAGLVAAYALFAREPEVASDSTLILRIGGNLPEVEPGGVFGSFLPSPPTVRAVVDSLRKAKVDSRVGGVLLVPGQTDALWAKVQEIRDAVVDFKRSRKPVVAYLEYGGDQEYYLATACDRIFLMPTSTLDLNGVANYELFFRGTLDKIGTVPDLLHIGEYKTASNTFTHTGFTPAHREMSESLTSDVYQQLVRAVADSRHKSEADVRAVIDQGPFLPENAVRAGLVDDLAYEDQIDDKVRLGRGRLRRLEASDYSRVSAWSLGLNKGPRIAVIYAVGLIASGESHPESAQGSVVGSETLNRYIRTARADESIKAIVLRVDSPGGSAVASDVIWRELMLTRAQKPVVASLSDVAASGGYYIAMPAHAIVSQPGTLTGSIGVVTGKFVPGGTLEKLGVSVETVSRGLMADMNSPIRPYSAEERAKVAEQMQATYDQFVEKVAQARNTTPERIDAVAQGRVWTGRQAKQMGLVDELGGLTRALVVAKARAKIAQDAEVELVIYPPRKTLYEIVADPWDQTQASLAGAMLNEGERRALAMLMAPLRLFRHGEPLTLMPYVFLRR
jgi:protease-4